MTRQQVNHFNVLRRLFGSKRTRRRVVQAWSKQERPIRDRQVTRRHFRRNEDY